MPRAHKDWDTYVENIDAVCDIVEQMLEEPAEDNSLFWKKPKHENEYWNDVFSDLNMRWNQFLVIHTLFYNAAVGKPRRHKHTRVYDLADKMVEHIGAPERPVRPARAARGTCTVSGEITVNGICAEFDEHNVNGFRVEFEIDPKLFCKIFKTIKINPISE